MAHAVKNFVCPYDGCYFSTDVEKTLNRHVIRMHRFDSNFLVSCPSCEFSTNKWDSLKKHMHRKSCVFQGTDAAYALDQEDQSVPESCHGEQDSDEELLNNTECDFHDHGHFVGKFVLDIETNNNISQKAVDRILNATEFLVSEEIEKFKIKVRQELMDKGFDDNFLDDIPVENLFEELSSEKRRKVFYSEHFNMLEAIEVSLSDPEMVLYRGKHKSDTKKGYVIPFEESLKNFLSLPDVWKCVTKTHTSSTGLMKDICDGQYVKNNNLFKDHPNALQIILNTDNLEIANPLGSKARKHKLTMFYYTLGNIEPKLMSSLNAIQLVGIAKTKYLRTWGIKSLLDNFLGTMNRLSTEGIDMNLQSEICHIKGALVLVSCDTLASNWIGGFKEGVSFAFKACRTCDATQVNMKKLFTEENFNRRQDDTHRERCRHLEQLSRHDKKFWSKLWGINTTSCLLELENFNFCDGLVQDPMHLLLEGVIPYELSLLLCYCIYENNYFTLDFLNDRLQEYPRYTLQDKTALPERIEKKHIDNNQIKQTSSAMITLCSILPFIIGPLIPEKNDKWTNFLLLLQILQLSTSPVCDFGSADMLAQIIEDHNTRFVVLYPEASVIPKMHFLVHFPEQMRLYGPTRHHWVMRFEAKHSFFKTHCKTKNFKNVAKTFCYKHEKYMCNQQTTALGSRSKKFLYSGHEIHEYNEVHFTDEMKTLFVDEMGEHCTGLYETKKVKVHGNTFVPGLALVADYNYDDLPQFYVIANIYVKTGKVYFFCNEMRIETFDCHVMSYVVRETGVQRFLLYESLFSCFPLPVRWYENKKCIANKYSHRIEYL